MRASSTLFRRYFRVSGTTAAATATTTTTIPSSQLTIPKGVLRRNFHFGSTDYARAFRHLPKPNMEAIRASSQVYLKSFDPQLWYNDPVRLLADARWKPGAISIWLQ